MKDGAAGEEMNGWETGGGNTRGGRARKGGKINGCVSEKKEKERRRENETYQWLA